MKPAPVFDCARCQRRIGKLATHYLAEDGSRHWILCRRCLDRAAHDELFPDCGVRWHDVLDHKCTPGTRAGIAAHLGLWPHKRRPSGNPPAGEPKE